MAGPVKSTIASKRSSPEFATWSDAAPLVPAAWVTCRLVGETVMVGGTMPKPLKGAQTGPAPGLACRQAVPWSVEKQGADRVGGEADLPACQIDFPFLRSGFHRSGFQALQGGGSLEAGDFQGHFGLGGRMLIDEH